MKEQERVMKQQEKIQRQEQIRVEREMRAQQIMEVSTKTTPPGQARVTRSLLTPPPLRCTETSDSDTNRNIFMECKGIIKVLKIQEM